MKPYPRYKPTGLAWLPSVPEHWEVVKLRQVLSQTSEKNHADKPLLSVVREKGVILRDTENKEENHNFIPDDLSNYKLVRKYQFAMNKMKAWQGSYGVSQHEGIVSPAYFVFDLHGVSCDFFHVAIRSSKYIDYFAQASDGIRVGQWDLSIPRMKEIPFVVPPPSEQDRIVRYLDEKTAAIDELVRAKEREIDLLRERKQALVSDAVTGGLDPATERKDSGVPWIGKIPAYWIPIAIKRILLRNDGGVWGDDPTGNNDTIVLRSTEQTLEGDWCLSDPAKRHLSSQEQCMAILQEGDVLVTKSSGSLIHIGKATLVSSQIEKQHCCYSNFMQRLRVKPTLALPSYLWRVLNSVICKQQILINATTTTGLTNLTGTIIGRMTIPLPPLPEQERIVAHLDSVCSELDAAEAAIRKQIALLQELRTRLVSDAVTGAVEVQ